MTEIDLDSLVSALTFAYLAQATQLHPSSKYIPFYNQRSELLHLRPENLYAFDRVSLSIADNILLQDEISPQDLSKAGVKIALVDHNRMDAVFGEAKVVSILDHHQDEGQHPDANPRVIKTPVGSCTSLVTTFFKDSLDKLPGQLADLLLS
jgi:exopolyphosphatase